MGPGVPEAFVGKVEYLQGPAEGAGSRRFLEPTNTPEPVANSK